MPGPVCVSKVWRILHVSALMMLAAISSSSGQTVPSPADIQTFLADGPRSATAGLRIDPATVQRFYVLRGYKPAWALSNGDTAIALAALASAAGDGLNSEDYQIEAIEARKRSPRAEAAVAYEVLLSASLLQYEHDLRVGRLAPESLFDDVALPKEPFDPAADTDAALARHGLAEYLNQLAPQYSDYRHLKLALARYRAIEERGGWPTITSIADDATGRRSEHLRSRLATEDPSAAGKSDDRGEQDLLAALRRYQIRNGLTADGQLSKATLASLNVSVSERISDIEVNMERWRWMPRSPGSTYVEANAADASLKVVKDNETILISKIIVGKPSTPTPIFAATVEAITVNPYWVVPAPIARREIAPKIRKNPNYLASHHMFVDAQGGIRQRPGPDNSLGQLKLEMPNRFDAYLHDTPERKLFAREKRYFSHGCMRIEKIKPLASIAMTGDPAAGLGKIEAAIATGANKRIPLDKSLPVYVLYWTAMADDHGAAGFRPDIYGRDQKLLAALAGKQVAERAARNTYSDCGASAG